VSSFGYSETLDISTRSVMTVQEPHDICMKLPFGPYISKSVSHLLLTIDFSVTVWLFSSSSGSTDCARDGPAE